MPRHEIDERTALDRLQASGENGVREVQLGADAGSVLPEEEKDERDRFNVRTIRAVEHGDLARQGIARLLDDPVAMPTWLDTLKHQRRCCRSKRAASNDQRHPPIKVMPREKVLAIMPRPPASGLQQPADLSVSLGVLPKSHGPRRVQRLSISSGGHERGPRASTDQINVLPRQEGVNSQARKWILVVRQW